MLKKLYPSNLWKHFEKICSIPHPSKHEERLAKYLEDFGKSLNLETIVDKTGNIIIKKPATVGFENTPSIILQAHFDMVPQKNQSVKHDFINDPILPYIDGEWVTAQDTTLGADNGIGLASILAVLEANDLQHGPIEALFTIDEETGMTGAFGIEKEMFSSKILINTDTEDDRELIIGCAGGIELNAKIPITKTEINIDSVFVNIQLKGLKGGHSGIDINLGRANANKEIVQIFKKISENFSVQLVELSGGNMRNAIPREANIVVSVNEAEYDLLITFIKELHSELFSEFTGIEDSLIVTAEKSSKAYSNVIAEDDVNKIIEVLNILPNGVIAYEKNLENVVETSTNLSIIETQTDKIIVDCLLRSSDEIAKSELAAKMSNLLSGIGAEVSLKGNYPGWKPSSNSPILELFKDRYKLNYGREAEVKVVHAGLECGIIDSIMPGVDMISFGPTIKHPHSPDEKVNILSVGKYWDLLIDIIKNI